MKILDKEEEEHILQVSGLMLYQPSLSYIYILGIYEIKNNLFSNYFDKLNLHSGDLYI